MRRVSAFLLLILHVNLFMCTPQIEECDYFTDAGSQGDDINSLPEFVDQIVLGTPDDTPEDEDNDSGRNFNLTAVYTFDSLKTEVFPENNNKFIARTFFPCLTEKTHSVPTDIVIPPPKA